MAGAPSATRKHPHLTDAELSEFREIFNLVDLDKGGSIDQGELMQLMNTLGLKPNQVCRRARHCAARRTVEARLRRRPAPLPPARPGAGRACCDGRRD